MTTLATPPELEQTQLEYYDTHHLGDDPDDYAGDPLTSYAFDINKLRRSVETLEEASRAFCGDILTMKRQLHQLAATITDLQTEAAFSVPDDELY